jgi:CRP/FNR family transcriptional regulator
VRAGAFVAGLDAHDLQRLERSKIAHSYRRGQALFYEGNPCTGVFCVRTAFVRLVKIAPHGRRHLLSLAGPGDLLGLEAAVTSSAYSYGAEVISDGYVCQIERGEMLRLVETHPAFQRAAMARLASDLRQSQGERAELAGGEVPERTAHTILMLASRFGERADGKLHLELDLTREDLAEMVGVAVETVIRQLTDLKHRGILSTVGRSIVVEDPERLARIALSREESLEARSDRPGAGRPPGRAGHR